MDLTPVPHSTLPAHNGSDRHRTTPTHARRVPNNHPPPPTVPATTSPADAPTEPWTALERSIRAVVADEVRRALASDRQPAGRSPTVPMERPAEAVQEAMTADDVADFLGVDRKTVYDYANRGEIPHRKLGKRLLFSRQALVAWLGECNARRAGR